jgi:hypothetical protein
MPPSRRPDRKGRGKTAPPVPANQDLLVAPSEEEAPVFEEIYHRGGDTAEVLTARLRKGGVRCTAADVETALRSLRKKGWVKRSRWRWHLTTPAIQYMR